MRLFGACHSLGLRDFMRFTIVLSSKPSVKQASCRFSLMATFFFNQGAPNGGAGTPAAPFNQAALNAAIAAGTFRTGGLDDIQFQGGGTGTLVLSASDASSTPITNVSGGALTVQISQAVLDNTTTLDLTQLISPVAAATFAVQNVNGGTTFAVNTNSVLRLNAEQARNLTVFGRGTVSIANIQNSTNTLSGDYRTIITDNVTATAALTAAVISLTRSGSCPIAMPYPLA